MSYHITIYKDLVLPLSFATASVRSYLRGDQQTAAWGG